MALACTKSKPPAPSDSGAAATSSTATSSVAPAPAHDVREAAVVTKDTGGLDAIKTRGQLRVLVQRGEEDFLPRRGTPALRDVETAEAFARSLGVSAVFVVIEAYDELIPALLEGRGDLIAAQLTVTPGRREQIAFSRSTFGVAEILVGRRGAKDSPKTVEELAGRTVHVRKSSSYAETLAKLKTKDGLQTLNIAYAAEHEDAEQIVFSVSQGERALTVVDSHILTAIESYNPNFERLFSLNDKREIAWAVRKSNPKLRTAVDDFVLQRALTSHREGDFSGDLDGIKTRKTLRVLTRNNPVTYFLYRGRQYGFEFELAELMAKQMGVRLEIVVPPSREDLVPWLLQGKGDVIAAGMSITDERKGKIAFSRPYRFVNEVLVQPLGKEGPKAINELAGLKIHVRPSSSYRETLQQLKAQGIDLSIVAADESRETEELIRQVAAGTIGYTVSDHDLVDVEVAYGAKAQAGLVLTPPPEGQTAAKQIAYGVRPDAPQLKAWLDGFVKRTYRGLEYNIARKRYFKNRRTLRSSRKGRLGKSGRISPYDDIIKTYARRYGLDWRLLAAQAYVESQFDPKAKSWVGAKGLFQVMPRTGASMGFKDLEDPRIGTHAGVKYLRRLVDRLDPKIPLKDRVRLGLAAYNAGLGHVYDAQRLAKQKGWDPNRWFNNVEKAMLLLAQPKYAKQARHGYCRGGEPVKYVSHIQTLYEAYVEVADP